MLDRLVQHRLSAQNYRHQEGEQAITVAAKEGLAVQEEGEADIGMAV